LHFEFRQQRSLAKLQVECGKALIVFRTALPVHLTFAPQKNYRHESDEVRRHLCGQARKNARRSKTDYTDGEKKIVVLSAVSGTTNALVNISTLLAKGDREPPKEH
jgi:hypothetical protein